MVTATGAAQGSVTSVLPHFYFRSMQHSTANRSLCRPRDLLGISQVDTSFSFFVNSLVLALRCR